VGGTLRSAENRGGAVAEERLQKFQFPLLSRDCVSAFPWTVEAEAHATTHDTSRHHLESPAHRGGAFGQLITPTADNPDEDGCFRPHPLVMPPFPPPPRPPLPPDHLPARLGPWLGFPFDCIGTAVVQWYGSPDPTWEHLGSIVVSASMQVSVRILGLPYATRIAVCASFVDVADLYARSAKQPLCRCFLWAAFGVCVASVAVLSTTTLVRRLAEVTS